MNATGYEFGRAEGMTKLDFKKLQRCIEGKPPGAPLTRDEPIYELGPRKALLIGNRYADETVNLHDRLPRLYTPGADVDELERVTSCCAVMLCQSQQHCNRLSNNQSRSKPKHLQIHVLC